MSFNLFTEPLKGLGAEGRAIWGSFAPNGTSNPLLASNSGPPGLRAFTVVYSATGVYTVTLPVDCGPPTAATILLSAQADVLADYFEVIQIGAYNATTRTFVVQAKQGASGVAVAANAGARIHFAVLFNDSGV